MEPLYSFTIPSIEDDIPLDCRIYHNSNSLPVNYARQRLRGAVIAHPYPPLGGCYGDPVVLSLTETLLSEGYIVITFNFRGAGDSAGRTSWTGNNEVLDYTSVVGLLFYYLQHLQEASQESNTLSPIMSVATNGPQAEVVDSTKAPFNLLLSGYSFGALILARLPPVSTIVDRFETAERGTAGSEIILRARKLATQTLSVATEAHSPMRGRTTNLSSTHGSHAHPKASPVTLGGEETDASDRRRSRDSRRSADVVREVLPRKSHFRHHSGERSKHSTENNRPTTAASSTGRPRQSFSTAYLLVSPVLLPLTTTICPPGLPFSQGQRSSGLLSVSSPTTIIFGAQDGFTSAKKLRQWAEKLCQQDSSLASWEEIEHAGHFWREAGAMQRLHSSVAAWVRTLT